MVADEAFSHAKGMLAESGVGPFHLAFEKIRADHAGTTNSLGAQLAQNLEYTHSPTFISSFSVS
jgi:hypothetical protein